MFLLYCKEQLQEDSTQSFSAGRGVGLDLINRRLLKGGGFKKNIKLCLTWAQCNEHPGSSIGIVIQ